MKSNHLRSYPRPFALAIARIALLVLIVFSARVAPARAAGYSFTSLGDLPGGNVGNEAFGEAVGVSADGSVVVGWGYLASGREAFRWTRSGGMVGLEDLSGGASERGVISVGR